MRVRVPVRGGPATLVIAGIAAIGAACSAVGSQATRVSLAPTLLFPRDVLSNAASVSLAVYTQTSAVTCNATTGQAAGVTSATPTVDSTTLGTCPATSTSKFCGTLTITESTSTLVFAATALDATGATIAYGCTASVVNTASLALSISMIRNAPVATCGNGIIEPTEQCDPPAPDGGTDFVCDSECHSQEELLSTGTTTPQGPAFFLWPPGTGNDFLAFFTDANGGGGTNADVALRMLTDALEPVSAPAAAASAILAPNDTSGVLPPLPAPANQSQPSAAYLDSTYFYVFTDDVNGPPSVHMRSFDTTLTGQQPQSQPIVIDGPANPPPGTDAGVDGGADASVDGGDTSASPSIAVNGAGVFFIAWQDATTGQIFGTTYTPTGGVLGATSLVSATGATNENVSVAGTASGWLVVWDDATQIKLRAYSSNGTASGAEIIVSGASHTGTQDHPAIAVLSDGRAAVAWADHGTSNGADIFVQRYDANVVPVANDQTTAINDLVTTGDQITPAIAGTTAAGGSFVAAWLDVPSGQVRGRVLDGTTGFDFNPIDGTSTEFQASIASGLQRENPVVVVGGAGPWAAIGWDVTGVVYARRFPTSTETQQ